VNNLTGKQLQARKCRERCAGGSRCVCDAAFRHVFHICSDPYCKCHTSAAYGVPGLWEDVTPPADPLEEGVAIWPTS